ncbi:MAG: PQQ-binding-like beta-propeller repeat protein [Anaerolineaceae bacterium]|nr:PQQ-binding-like beta-propeller repeat protein [Anaerolineaceae bacterium]
MKTFRYPLLVLVLALTVLLSACSGALTATSWPGMTADQKNAYLAEGPYIFAVRLNDGGMAWRFPEKAGKGFYATPALTTDGQLIVGGYDNVLYSINPQNGTQNWTFTDTSLDRWISGVLTTGQDIYAPNVNRFLYHLDLRGGVKHKFETNNANWAAPAADDNLLYLPSMDHFLYAIDKTNESQKWKVDLGGAIAGTPAISTDGVLYAGTMNNEVVAIDATSGKILWRFPTIGGVWSGPALKDKMIYFGDLKGTFYGVDTTTHKATIQITPDGPIVSTPLLLKDRLIFVTESGSVQAIDFTGKILWNHTINGKLYTTPVQAGDHTLVAVTQGDQLLAALDQNGNQVWSFTPPK